MSWKIGIVVALLTALITALVTGPVADKLTGMHGVPNVEGRREFSIVFLFMPTAFVVGFLLGLLGTRLVGPTDWMHFWKALGVSVLLGQVALWGVAGLSLLALPRPPVVDGHRLALEMEVRVPRDRLPPEWASPGAVRMSLYAGHRDNHYLGLDPTRFRLEDDALVVPARTVLNSRTPFRSISFLLGAEVWVAHDLPLPATPVPDGIWSGPWPMRDARDARSKDHPSGATLRYRVVRDETVPWNEARPHPTGRSGPARPGSGR